MEPVVVGPRVARRPVRKRHVPVGQALRGVEHRMVQAGAVEKLQPPLRPNGRVEGSLLAMQPVQGMERVQRGEHLAERRVAVAIERRLDELVKLSLVFHHVAIGVRVPRGHLQPPYRREPACRRFADAASRTGKERPATWSVSRTAGHR